MEQKSNNILFLVGFRNLPPHKNHVSEKTNFSRLQCTEGNSQINNKQKTINTISTKHNKQVHKYLNFFNI